MDSSPLSSMSQAVPTARARLTGSGSDPRGEQHLQRRLVVRTDANVRSPSLSRCRSATGRSSRYVVVPVVSTRMPTCSSPRAARV